MPDVIDFLIFVPETAFGTEFNVELVRSGTICQVQRYIFCLKTDRLSSGRFVFLM